ncbi:uncharacterized protein LOC126356105 [Schistocerca gregaria]|uniref:uncharacterized protein LOC126356105 n=1 Tax=Schistocerca gregaria TaxID=7010 RepID=UPI00211DFE22|nr:uncharacterized protein LOC126356105 [Schistocerca gregaria]
MDPATIRVLQCEEGIMRKIVLVSANLPYEDSSPPPPLEVRRLGEACHRQGDQLLVGCDANAHNLVWGSNDTNSREILQPYNQAKTLPVFMMENGGLVISLKFQMKNMI